MTRKHYIALAQAIHSAVERHPEAKACAYDMAQAIATALAGDNPRFNRSKFLKACGV